MSTSTNFRLIPAIDLIGGQCVRLQQGDYSTEKVYNEDPLAVAQDFESAGIQYLHVVDLDGAKAGKVINYEVIERLCKQTNLTIDFGGGLRTTEEVRTVLNLGVSQITAGSMAAKNPELVRAWLSEFGPEKVIIGTDLKEGKVAIHGWETASALAWPQFMDHYVQLGAEYFICTDISRDGMLSGPAIKLYQEILQSYPDIKLVASGGIAEDSDLDDCQAIGMDGAIFGKAFYEGRISLAQLSDRIKTGKAC
ncbi:MAG: 1-(5-phosphoribosyl)-5-[(5-phosphoribosylamino)methylideneamino]imidazole-4-carboxamide isomerase [Bacteroidota bacterium]